MILMRLLLSFLIFIFSALQVNGQNLQLCKATSAPGENNDTSELYFTFENFNFFKNKEYKNNFIKGYTKLGFFINPKITWQIFKGTKISTGGHFLKFQGKNNLQTGFIFTAKQRITQGIQLNMGTLDRGVNHGLIDPLYYKELFIDEHVENGFQFLINKPFIKADLWINWKKFITKDDPFQENFITGAQIKIPVWKEKKNFNLSIPVQFIAEHYGGEIDLSPAPASTEVNLASGLQMEWKLKTPFLQKICWKNFWAGYKELTNTNKYLFPKGEAFYSKIGLKTNPFLWGMSYWNGSGFKPVNGNPLYSSVSSFDHSIISKNRELMSAHLAIYREKKGIFLSLNLNGYYDLNYNDLDYSYSLYLLINKDFKLKELLD